MAIYPQLDLAVRLMHDVVIGVIHQLWPHKKPQVDSLGVNSWLVMGQCGMPLLN